MSGVKKHILFIINPASGVKHARKATIEQVIDRTLDSGKYEWECVYSVSADHVFDLSSKAAQIGIDIVASVGGDGTANRVVKGLKDSQTALALIPAGSGNGLARYLGIPPDINKSIELLNHAHTRVIDTISLNNDLFASIAGVGFDAMIAESFAIAGQRGFTTYFKLALQAYPLYRPRTYHLVIDGQPITREALFISFANSNQFGYNTIIAPDACIDDGWMDVCIVKKAPFIEAPYILGMIWQNRLVESGYLEIIKAKHVTLSRETDRVVNLDGEPVQHDKDLVITVNPASLKVMVP